MNSLKSSQIAHISHNKRGSSSINLTMKALQLGVGGGKRAVTELGFAHITTKTWGN